MPRFRFTQRYEAELRTDPGGGIKVVAAAEGDVVDLDEVEAAFIERDAPGTLAKVPEPKAERSVDHPPKDRLSRGGRRRRDRAGDPSDAGPMTRADVATVVKD